MRLPEPGEDFDRYRIDRQVGAGGMGIVFAATDRGLDRRVAIKVLSSHLATNPEFLERFHRETSVLARLDSPHAITIHDSGQHEGLPYIVTQYVGGGDLEHLLHSRGPLPLSLAARVCAQVAEALHDAHRAGIVHRDVKPSNVLLRDPDATRPFAHLCDFGIAVDDSRGLTGPGQIAGSWAYLAPERALGRPATPASDIYSVGCLLWTLLLGRPPYSGVDTQQALAHVNAPVPQITGTSPLTGSLNAFFARCLAKDPASRYPSARALADELHELAQRYGSGVFAGPSGPGRTSGPGVPSGPGVTMTGGSGVHGRTRSRRAGVLLAAAAAVVLLIGGAVTAVVVTRGDDGSEPSSSPTSDPATDDPSGPTEEPDPPGVDAAERAALLDQATRASVATVRLSADSFDFDVRSAQKLMTPTYAASFGTTTGRLRETYLANATTVTARDAGTGIVSVDEDKAEILSFLTEIKRESGGEPETTQTAGTLTMRRKRGEGNPWLLDGVAYDQPYDGPPDPDPERAAIIDDATEIAERYLNVDYRKTGEFVRAMREVATPSLAADIASDRYGLLAGYRSQRSVYTGSVDVSALRSRNGDSAIALASVDGTYADRSTGGVPQDAMFYMRLALNQIGGEWRVRRFTFIS